MSYILDALKKSDQQRNLGTLPNLQIAQASAPAPKRPSAIYYGSLAVILLCAGVAIGLLRPWQAEQAASGTGQTEQDSPLAVSHQATPAATHIEDSPVAVSHQAAPSTTTASPGVTGDVGHQIAAEHVRKMPASPASNVQEQDPIPFDELPFTIQREIPDLTAQLRAYSSEPGERFVYINSKKLRQGDPVMPGLTLERITLRAATFEFRGHRFEIGY